jgi:hypothetical protein
MKMRERVYLDPSLKVPVTHPWLFSALYLPAVGSTIAGSIIYRFSWFNLLIPGLCCFFVSCFIIQGLTTGIMTDNHGTVSRWETPVRYWIKVGIWSSAYLFALVFPIGYALQERDRLQHPQNEVGIHSSASAP